MKREDAYSISTLLAKKLSGEITESEQAELDEWVNASPENKRTFDLATDPAYKSERDSLIREIDVEADLRKVSQELFRLPHKKQIQLWYKIAAAIALLFVITTVLYFNNRPSVSTSSFEAQVAQIKPGTPQAMVKLHDGRTILLADSSNQNKTFEEENGASIFNQNGSLSYHSNATDNDELIYNEVHVPRGGEYKITLSDGTQVWINSETQLRFPVEFPAGERKVELTGEAYFAVAHESQRPFIVTTLPAGTVQVHGTEFNINAYPDNARVLITLNEGKVSVSKSEGNAVTLRPNEQAILNKTEEKITVAQVDASQFSAWKDGLLVFENMSLYEISKLLARWYDVQFEFENDAIKQYRFTADIKRYGSFKDVLKFFEKTNQIQFEIDGRTIKILDKKSG